MKSKILKVSITLAAIAGISAGLIGLVNAITEPVIAANALKKVEQQKKVPFGNDVDIAETENDLSSYKLTYVKKSWDASQGGNKIGTLFQAEGTNQYGSVSLLIGVYTDGSLTDRSILENTESYKTTLEDNYISVYNQAAKENKKQALGQIKCGATFGATLINNRVTEAEDLASGKGSSVTAGLPQEALNLFGDQADNYSEDSLSAYKLTYVQNAYTANKGDSKVGRIYSSALKADNETIPVYLAIDKDNQYGNRCFGPDYTASSSAEGFVSGFNSAKDKKAYLDSLKGNGSSDDDITAGPTWPYDANKDDEDSSSSSAALDAAQTALQGFAKEARTISDGTATRDTRFACFDSGEVDAFTQISNATGTFIQKIDKATKGGKDVAYVYDLKGENDTQGGKKHREISFAVYIGGALGKIAVIENGQTPSYYGRIKSKFIDAFNTSSDRKAFLNQNRQEIVAGASSGADLLVNRRKEAILDAEAR